MKKKGRPSKKHEPINASFDEVLGAIAGSKYRDEKKITKNKNKGKKIYNTP
ncbi:MAG: hypothetical protein UT51_C0005G0029 [Candidatus Nomurabacteria bacterium GW2011_GWC2_39_41]|uniref:Uncharacterized protein n=2 Tax=Candidatus Nomuraibacteriota TaxID=1752729 RepID=A0A837HTC6_9BACT|nr:MAG: hypothetical protein UT27_C0005G0030 [Candidatus Nomurabacteria bacterium GW2011_GWD2_39_12]KKR20296.1 MAG: hypothetical protein UT51_C0005G0029 [Candidatus Nomurabacteria bacterium GW2011_GWC2_39_41]KKR36542.1 MAG: hypothetical protein UT70_C0010G0029 [Candidatus Nomurabacteria bacterium GW2011_GWE2_40_10]KKR38389.1 MAG: hypothetical protein UT73_C0003G0029 [Candidatus Nomurabacteria bacterium GW2011_GWB1_40_11]KKR39888.1 MAG: hypothetical protein UT74_C0005G0105 [Parcubacteria group b